MCLTCDKNNAVFCVFQLLFKDGQPRWERLQSLLEEAGTTSDYDITLAADQLLAYLVSDKGQSVRDILSVQLVEILDTLGADATDFALSFASLTARGQLGAIPFGPVFRQGQKPGESFNLNALSEALLKAAAPTAQAAKPSPALVEAYRALQILRSNDGLDGDKLTAILRNVLKEPVAQSVLSKVLSELSERAAARFVRRVLTGPVVSGAASAFVNSELKSKAPLQTAPLVA